MKRILILPLLLLSFSSFGFAVSALDYIYPEQSVNKNGKVDKTWNLYKSSFTSLSVVRVINNPRPKSFCTYSYYLHAMAKSIRPSEVPDTSAYYLIDNCFEKDYSATRENDKQITIYDENDNNSITATRYTLDVEWLRDELFFIHRESQWSKNEIHSPVRKLRLPYE